MFQRDDWMLFRDLSTLSQKAGVPLRHLRALVLKELVDNALDAGASVEIDESKGLYCVKDDGPGIPGDAQQIAQLFSIRRPLTSSKMLRLPSRGALGNGLRVVAGAVLASDGKLIVETRGRSYELKPQDDGTTKVISEKPGQREGTTIYVALGASVPAMPDPWCWAKIAKTFQFAKLYKGKTSPFWYDSGAFYELLMASQMPLDELMSYFDGRADLFDLAKPYRLSGERSTTQLSREQADDLLNSLRACSKPIDPKKLGEMGDRIVDSGYAKQLGTLTIRPSRGRFPAELPYVVEVCCTATDGDDDQLNIMVNGTPVTGEMSIRRGGGKKPNVIIFGCGLAHKFNVTRRTMMVTVNVITPYMPITTDGKEPDLGRYVNDIAVAMAKASKRLRRRVKDSRSTDASGTQKAILEAHLHEACDKCSGGGKLRFSLRQLFYALRPYILEEAPEDKRELSYNYFSTWVGEWEAANGEIAGMYRDPRGKLYHPHTRQTISIGTLAVEKYRRPEWTFNKVLYIEKQGLFEVLIQARFPERYDCALLSSQGYASRAVRDLIDLLGDDNKEPIYVYCIHDADGDGTMIHQTLAGASGVYRGRRIEVVNLGLEPWEALEMGLQVETFDRRERRTRVARYVEELGDEHDEPLPDDFSSWVDWLQTNRVELNAMTSPQFLAWLEAKFDALEVERKVIPPEDVLAKRLLDDSEGVYRAELTERILKENRFEERVIEKRGKLEQESYVVEADRLRKHVERRLGDVPVLHWTAPVIDLAQKLGKV